MIRLRKIPGVLLLSIVVVLVAVRRVLERREVADLVRTVR